MKKKPIYWLLLALCLVVTQVFAQYEIIKHSINNGGGTSVGGIYEISGSIGQVDANNELTGNDYSITGGFWSQSINTDIIFKNGFEN